jgi:hypothetical protein
MPSARHRLNRVPGTQGASGDPGSLFISLACTFPALSSNVPARPLLSQREVILFASFVFTLRPAVKSFELKAFDRRGRKVKSRAREESLCLKTEYAMARFSRDCRFSE